jgi:hypothetical protein
VTRWQISPPFFTMPRSRIPLFPFHSGEFNEPCLGSDHGSFFCVEYGNPNLQQGFRVSIICTKLRTHIALWDYTFLVSRAAFCFTECNFLCCAESCCVVRGRDICRVWHPHVPWRRWLVAPLRCNSRHFPFLMNVEICMCVMTRSHVPGWVEYTAYQVGFYVFAGTGNTGCFCSEPFASVGVLSLPQVHMNACLSLTNFCSSVDMAYYPHC